MIVKVCGMRDADNIREADRTGGIDLMGFIFYPRSPRYVAEKPTYLPQQARRVGVFVNEQPDRIRELAEDYSLDYLQLHGNEQPALCRELRHTGRRIIKALPVATADDFRRADAYEECADYLLFDTRCSGYGGSGHSFDWSLLDAYTGKVPFLLSGGIAPEHADDLLSLHHPRWAGVDLNSRFETAPGVKDIAAVQAFISKLKPQPHHTTNN
jgi:phosphoribosylanthranilate isomerase